jgi:hypothetical protein
MTVNQRTTLNRGSSRIIRRVVGGLKAHFQGLRDQRVEEQLRRQGHPGLLADYIRARYEPKGSA